MNIGITGKMCSRQYTKLLQKLEFTLKYVLRMRNKISLHIKKGGGKGNNGSTVWPGLIFYRVTHNSLALEE
jgi:hypothetical protein